MNKFKSWLNEEFSNPKSNAPASYMTSVKILADIFFQGDLEMLYQAYLESPVTVKAKIDRELNSETFKDIYQQTGHAPSYLENSFLSASNAKLYKFAKMHNIFSTKEAFVLNLDKDFPMPKRTEPFQSLFFGPPGTGKSHKLNQQLKELSSDEDGSQNKEQAQRSLRVIGHPELTNAQFIGTYRPIMKADALIYSFCPGPFTKLLYRALRDLTQPYVLIIEELNRTNAAAMFAEAFQLLDRGSDGWSEYATDLGDDVLEYLHGDDQKIKELLQAGVKLPPNFAIWATMNTADQGVFPMDTAFKRRWSFEYLGVDEGQKIWSKEPWNPVIPKQGGLTWQALRQQINALLNAQGVDEDRQLGGFFLNQAELSDSDKLLEHIVNKVIGYLRDDVMRYEPEKLFKADASSTRAPSFSQLRKVLLNPNTSTNLLNIFAWHDAQEPSISKIMEDFDADRIEQETSQESLSTHTSANEEPTSESATSEQPEG